MVDQSKEFYTVRGYELLDSEDKTLTPSMEDYLEMAYRLGREKGYARIGDLAEALNVQPPSASKMVQKLTEMGCFNYKKYGIIEFTEQGMEMGEYLLKRHETIEKFLKMIGVMNNILMDTEKIEHSISDETFKHILLFVQFLEENSLGINLYKKYLLR